MNKKAYIQPTLRISEMEEPIMQKASVQFDNGGSTGIGEEGKEEDDFGAKDRGLWDNDGLW